ncbi:MAG: hypothetical protein IJO85_02625 [Lachnospiraceae bacterium]|nr:hypothetical protein [Lachnospiraceae bacterium]
MDKIKKHYGKILFLILLIIQCAYMIFWGTQKSGYYVDEFFTYDNAHYISSSTPERVKLYDADYMEYNKWFDVTGIKSTLMVQKEESLLNDSLIYNIKAFINKWPYMAILNYVEAIFFEGELNWWSAISINLVCFVINQILMYLLTMKICKRQNTAILATAMYGFCGMAISMLVYVRMYMWLTLLVTLFTYLHVLMWDEEKHWKNIIVEILAAPLVLLAFRDSPLPVIYAIALIGCFTIGLILRKKWIQVLYYSMPYIGGGAIYAVTQTGYVEIFMNPQQALQSGTLDPAKASLIQNMVSLNMNELIIRIVGQLNTISDYLFGHILVAIVYVIGTVLLVGIVIVRGKENNKIEIDRCYSFGYVIIGATCLFGIASLIFKLISIRYISFVFPMITISIVLVIMSLSEIMNKQKVITNVLIVLIMGQIFFTAYVPRVENLYPEEREALQSIQEHKGINSLVVDYHFDDRVMYESLAYTDEATKIMFSSFENIDYSELGDSILVWQTVNKSSEELEQKLFNAGYSSVESIAQTHESKVFLCMK